MAAETAADNRQHIERATGRTANATDLYMGHFLGPKGAADFLGAMAADPNQRADRILPAAAASNRPVFYVENGRSEERRVGKECVSTCRSRWSRDHYKKKTT